MFTFAEGRGRIVIDGIQAEAIEQVVQHVFTVIGEDDFLVTLFDKSDRTRKSFLQATGDVDGGFIMLYSLPELNKPILSPAQNIRLADMLDALRFYVNRDIQWEKYFHSKKMPWQMTKAEIAQNDEKRRQSSPRVNSFRRIRDPEQVLSLLLRTPAFINYCNELMEQSDFHPDEIRSEIRSDSPGLQEHNIYLYDAIPALMVRLIQPLLDESRLFLSEIDRRYRWDYDGKRKAQENQFMAWSRSVPAAQLIAILLKDKVINRSQAMALSACFDGKPASDMYLAANTIDPYRLNSVMLKVKGISLGSVKKIFEYLTSSYPTS